MKTDHPLLTDIRDAVANTGAHSHHWGNLRREVFTGLESWVDLKSWCAANAIECELAYSQSSKGAQVQFRKQRKADVVAAAAATANAEAVVAG